MKMCRNRKVVLLTTVAGCLLIFSYKLIGRDISDNVLTGFPDAAVQLDNRNRNSGLLGQSNYSHKVESVDDVATRLSLRHEHVKKVCERLGHITNEAKEVSGIKSANFSYCAVQKAGCTMWIRLFKFLHGQNLNSGDPMSLTKYDIHNKDPQHYVQFKFKGSDKSFIDQSLRATTVRDPYTRLWSAFIDKFLLPDFWISKGKQIIQMTRKNAKPLAIRCGHDVTFSEFIEYVVTIGHQFKYWNQDKHWLPSSDICDPCAFRPHIIGKQETFLEDLVYTLQRTGLKQWQDKITARNPTEFEIHEEIDYTFRVHSRVKNCIDKYELSKRLWTAFILNGYIPANETFPTNIDHGSLNAESFLELVRDVRARYNLTREQKKAIRRHALATAYKQIPEKHMVALRELYKNDFELYGYDPNPEYFNAYN